MRLIDADALIRTMRADPLYFVVERYNIEGPIHAAPTIDAIPVTRCRDCKNSEPWYRDRRRCFLWDDGGVSVWDDGFCNYAERKEE